MAERLPEGAFHQYVPLWITLTLSPTFLIIGSPDAAIFVESEFWPNLILGAPQKSAFRMTLVNGRMCRPDHLKTGNANPIQLDLSFHHLM